MKTSALILLLAVSFLQLFKSQCAFTGSGALPDDEDEYNEDYVENGGTLSKLFCNRYQDCHNYGKLCYNYIGACYCINHVCCDPYVTNCDIYAINGENVGLLDSVDPMIDSSIEEPPCTAYEENSPLCNGGTYDCGLCTCSPDKFGPNCECDAANLRLGANLEDGCRPDPNNQTLCNNRGDCMCGKCECYPSGVEGGYISGDFCECDNFSCDRHKGLLCSGPDHGECVCGKCACNSEWDVEGYSACECRNSEETCITPYGEHYGKMCSGRGTCSCGECVCTKNEDGDYTGTYCEEFVPEFFKFMKTTFGIQL